MKFQEGLVYHIFNQGNNRQRIFFKNDNYIYFLRKMRTHIAPYADIICYCLMPNHFHILIRPNSSASMSSKIVDVLKSSNHSSTNKNVVYKENLNHALGVMLGSYTRGINKQENRSGSLFRGKTKAKNGWVDQPLVAGQSGFGIGDGYEVTCFNYIHNNPVTAGLVEKATDWKYSSASDYAGLRNGTLCNLEIGRHLLSQW